MSFPIVLIDKFTLKEVYFLGLSFVCRRSKAAGGFLNQWAMFRKDMKVLLVDKVYVVNVLGNHSVLLTP